MPAPRIMGFGRRRPGGKPPYPLVSAFTAHHHDEGRVGNSSHDDFQSVAAPPWLAAANINDLFHIRALPARPKATITSIVTPYWASQERDHGNVTAFWNKRIGTDGDRRQG